MNCVADDRHRRPLADRGSPGRTHGNAVTNPRIRVCSTVVLTALPPAPRTRSSLPQPVPDNGMANPRPPSLTTNIRVSARELVVEPRVRLLPQHRRSLLRRLEPPHRPALAHHVHRPPGLGQCMMISAGWYNVSALLWKAYAAGQVTEAEASALSETIELRRALPAAQKPVRRLFGSRPRSGASMERRRRWASSGAMPPAIASRFTLAEQAVLGVVAPGAVQPGACTLPIRNAAPSPG